MHQKVNKLQVEKTTQKINLDDIQASSRKYPAIIFDQEREAGDQILRN